MSKLNINIEIEYEVVDCDNKLVIVKYSEDNPPTMNDVRLIKGVMKEEFHAKRVIFVTDNIKFKIFDTNNSIEIIDDYINKLTVLKEELLEKDNENDE